jgi:hypothetical protein
MFYRPAACCLVAALREAQAQQQPRTVSPVVHDGRRVTFRLCARNAKEVTVSGQVTPKPVATSKDEQDVWSVAVTVGPLELDFYSYTLHADRVAITDPSNRFPQTGIHSQPSSVMITGAPPAGWVGRFNFSMRRVHGQDRIQKALADPKAIDQKAKLRWIAIGKEDTLLQGNQEVATWTKAQAIEYKYQVTEGGHTWRIGGDISRKWRRNCSDRHRLCQG